MQKFSVCTQNEGSLPNGSDVDPATGRAILTTMRWSTPTSNQVCRDFMRNVCQRGSRCKYMHFLPPSNGFGAGSRLIFCRDYQNGSCRRPNCKFIHRSRNDEEFYNQTGQLPAASLSSDPVRNVAQPLASSLDGFGSQLTTASGYVIATAPTANGCTSNDLLPNCIEPSGMVSNCVPQPAPEVPWVSSLKRKLVSLADETEKGYGEVVNGIADGTSANGDLKRKIVELETKCRDLAAANELLLEQNARFRIGSSSLPCSSMALSLVQPVYTATTISNCAIAQAPPMPSACNPNTNTISLSHSLGNPSVAAPRSHSIASTGGAFAALGPPTSAVVGQPVAFESVTYSNSPSAANGNGSCRSTPAPPSVTLVPSFVCSSMPVPVQLHSAATNSGNEQASAVQLPAVATTTLNVPVNVPMSVCSVVPCANGAPNVAVPVSVTLSAPVSSCSLMMTQPAVGILSTSLLRTTQIGTLTVVANTHETHVNESGTLIPDAQFQLPVETAKMPTSLTIVNRCVTANHDKQSVLAIDKLNTVAAGNENEN